MGNSGAYYTETQLNTAVVRLILDDRVILRWNKELEQFLIICGTWVSIRRIDAMTKVLIKSEWWNFSVDYINLNDVQFYLFHTMKRNDSHRIHGTGC